MVKTNIKYKISIWIRVFCVNNYLSDIDECGIENNCSQICNNVDGSYFCECKTGYALSTDGFTCKGSYNIF